jgi:hypothetical protein
MADLPNLKKDASLILPVEFEPNYVKSGKIPKLASIFISLLILEWDC